MYWLKTHEANSKEIFLDFTIKLHERNFAGVRIYGSVLVPFML